MAIAQEAGGRGLGGFMRRSQDYWDRVRAADLQEEMRRQREAQAEAMEKAEAGGGEKEEKKDDRPASQRGLNTPSSSISSIGSNALTLPASARAGAGVGGATPVSFGSNSMTMYKALTELGVKPEVAAGAVGSMMGESGRHLNPAAYNPNDLGKPSGGALQWRGDRLSGLYNFAGTNDIRQIPIETQAKWMQQELQGKENGALQSLLKGNTVADGARSWTYDFERPHDKPGETARRTPIGQQFWSSMQNGSVPDTTPDGRNRDAGNAQTPVRVAADTTTMNDASPARTQQTGSTPPSPVTQTTPSAPQPTATPESSMVAAPWGEPPRRPETITPATSGPQFHENMGPPMPEHPAQPGAGGGFLKDIGSFFSGEPIKDANGREWDALYGFEKQPAEATAGASAGAAASDGKSILDLGGIGDDIDKGMSDAFNWFSSIFK